MTNFRRITFLTYIKAWVNEDKRYTEIFGDPILGLVFKLT